MICRRIGSEEDQVKGFHPLHIVLEPPEGPISRFFSSCIVIDECVGHNWSYLVALISEE